MSEPRTVQADPQPVACGQITAQHVAGYSAVLVAGGVVTDLSLIHI